ncbi:hypothetical protein Nepgr_011469 [Nepenthes gracilis]|uniref:PRONE domain-containing protein n=1 Tax=Nepenthes gracilis TaxID=150966 RepID=A0AAD3XLZ3_NEPGR|nr:hypothetical protein Nepgr_011469 [Nepenthes gracilis]
MIKLRRLTCCMKDKQISIDFDDHQRERMMTYDGLENCILKIHSHSNGSETSREDTFTTDSFDEDDTSCSSSKDAFGSSSQWIMKKDYQEKDEWDISESPQQFYFREKTAYVLQFSDIDVMKEVFAKLLLGEDVTGGSKGVTSALALSNAITKLAASVFGELWKLEPLPKEEKTKWRKEMDWLLSPANFMVSLVPAKQSGTTDRSFEIMTPKARKDVHMNLPALKKLDSMLIETLDSMANSEFWYVEGSRYSEGRDGSARQSRKWRFPLPRVPKGGLSENARKKLLCQGNRIHQVFKAAKSIHEGVLHEMLVPEIIKDAVPKSGKASLGDELYNELTNELRSAVEVENALNLKSEREALYTVNRLEAAALAWRDAIKEKVQRKSPVRTSWPFVKDPVTEVDKMESLLFRVETLLRQLKTRYPCLPHTFLDITKIQYGKDVGHSIIEAYSRVLGNLANNILSRIRDILQEDQSSNSDLPVAKCCFSGLSSRGILEVSVVNSFTGTVGKLDGHFLRSKQNRFKGLVLTKAVWIKEQLLRAMTMEDAPFVQITSFYLLECGKNSPTPLRGVFGNMHPENNISDV